MVHNGIEYGIIAAYAETLGIPRAPNVGKQAHETAAETTPLRDPAHYQYDLDLPDIAEVWRRGSVIATPGGSCCALCPEKTRCEAREVALGVRGGRDALVHLEHLHVLPPGHFLGSVSGRTAGCVPAVPTVCGLTVPCPRANISSGQSGSIGCDWGPTGRGA